MIRNVYPDLRCSHFESKRCGPGNGNAPAMAQEGPSSALAQAVISAAASQQQPSARPLMATAADAAKVASTLTLGAPPRFGMSPLQAGALNPQQAQTFQLLQMLQTQQELLTKKNEALYKLRSGKKDG